MRRWWLRQGQRQWLLSGPDVGVRPASALPARPSWRADAAVPGPGAGRRPGRARAQALPAPVMRRVCQYPNTQPPQCLQPDFTTRDGDIVGLEPWGNLGNWLL